MTLDQALACVLQRAGEPDDRALVITADEVGDWTTGSLEALVSARILRETSPASAIACDACDDGHWETPELITEPPGSTPRAYIPCGEGRRVQVDLRRLSQWRVDLKEIPAVVATLLQVGPATVDIPARLWRLGMISVGGGRWTAFFARGLEWSDGASIIRRVSRLRAPLLFSVGDGGIADGGFVVTLASILSLKDHALALSWPALEELAASFALRSPPFVLTPPSVKVQRSGRQPGLGFGPMLDCWTNCHHLDRNFVTRTDYYEAVQRRLRDHAEPGITVPTKARFPHALNAAAAKRETSNGCRWPRHDSPPSL